MSDPDRLAEIQAHRSELNGQIAPWARSYRDDIDWLIGEVTRLRALLEPSVTMTSPHRADPGTQRDPPHPEG